MLQRIQTIYLFLISVLTALLLFLPFCSVSAGTGLFTATMTHYFLLPLVVACLLVSLGSIFLYKNRALQIRLNYINIVFFVTMYAIAAWQVWETGFEHWTFQIAASIPFINILLTLFAIARIKKDEKLVRSLDRLR
jgi:glucose dehydrogenase